MTSEQFIFWLQGYFELNDPKTIDEKTIKTIRNHVNMVFKYEIDPSYSDDPKVQAELQALHDGTPTTFPSFEESFPPTNSNEKYRC